MDDKYYVVSPDGQRFGPADIATLKSWVAQKRIKPETKLIHAVTEAEVEARTVSGLFEASSAQPASGPSMPQFSAESVNWGAVASFLSPARFLSWLESGSIFNQLVGAVLRVLAVIAALFLIVMLVKVGDLFRGIEGLGVLAILIGLLIVVWAYLWNIQILWIRGGHIAGSTANDTPLLKLASLLMRTFGEVAFVLILGTVTATSVVLMLLPEYYGMGFGMAIPMGPVYDLVRGYQGALGGLVMLLAGFIYALLILFAAYLQAEILEIAVKGLGHLRAIRTKMESG